jgi:hypothetical protein
LEYNPGAWAHCSLFYETTTSGGGTGKGSTGAAPASVRFEQQTDCYSSRNGMGTYLNSPVNVSMESPEATTSGGSSLAYQGI